LSIDIKAPYSVFYATFRYIYEDDYPSKLNEDVVRGLIKAYSKEDDVILDPFCGSGVVLKVATEEKRRCVGIDISPEACELSKRYSGSVYLGDTLEFLENPPFKPSIFSLVMTSPPYGDSVGGYKRQYYTKDPRDLGNIGDPVIFRDKLKLFAGSIWKYVKPSGFLIVFLKDRQRNYTIIPYSTWFIEDATTLIWILRGRGFIPSPPFTTSGYTPADKNRRGIKFPSFIPSQEDIVLLQKPPLK
jgi:DNA modification methylase